MSSNDASAVLVPLPIGQSRSCAIFAVDIVGFTGAGRGDAVQLMLRRVLHTLVSDAFDRSALPWRYCLREDRGDGVLVVVPLPVAFQAVFPALLRRLAQGLALHNAGAAPTIRLRLRTALHAGIVHRDSYGVAGTAVNHLFRLLDAQPLRAAIAHGTVDLALMVSDRARAELPGLPLARVRVQVKTTDTTGWLCAVRP